MTTQIRNNEMVNLLRADFQPRYEPNFALAEACSTYLNLPGLRAFLPCSSSDSSGNLIDLSGQGRTFTNNATATYNRYNLATYIDLNGSTQYFFRADEAGLDFLGTDTFYVFKGLSLYAWIWIDAWNSYNGILTKIGATLANSNYETIADGFANTINYSVFNGANRYSSPSVPVSLNRWIFMCARYNPSTSLDLYIDGTNYTNTVGIPASLNNSTGNVEIGRAVGNPTFNGRLSLIGLYAAYHSAAQVFSVYQTTKSLFGV